MDKKLKKFQKLMENYLQEHMSVLWPVCKNAGDHMQVLKGYVFRLYPNKEQQELINKTIGSSRFVYNRFLEDKIRGCCNKENIIGNIKSVVIKRDAGKYYVSVLIEEPLIRPSFNPKSIIGLDLGIKDLSIRKWECPECHSIHKRDLNASIHIMFEGIKIYMKGMEQS